MQCDEKYTLAIVHPYFHIPHITKAAQIRNLHDFDHLSHERRIGFAVTTLTAAI